ncbi:hypothetical protein CIK05_06390 [Bdellovibrio sp. qaytius]|nr:hypothetical protein CIK05_06390 [Bdellovibrio sp. qaytius]
MSKLIFLWLMLHASLCNNKSSYLYVVFWNTGQGQWVTAITPDECQHFDFGGEISYFRANQNLFLQLCKDKQNILELSHPDLDHYAFYQIFTRLLPRLCWKELDHTNIPANKAGRKIPLCTQNKYLDQARIFKPTEFSNKNDSSKIYRYKNILIPGDSSIKMEKAWVKLLIRQKLNYLLLGHHGSRTSTSDLLLERLPQIKMAIAQSRMAKFNHPHKEVLERLKHHRIPVIRTEDWGNTAIIY